MTQIGYVPHSKDLSHPADRRRIAGWARSQEINLNIDQPLVSDILVLSNAANFGYWLKRAEQPVILDLVDAYLGEQGSFLKDFIRNIVRTIRGTSSLHWVTYTAHIRRACQRSYAVIVASEEQRELILPFNKNVYIISDDHSEVDQALLANPKEDLLKGNSSPKNYIFWEGFGYTIKHFEFMSADLDHFLKENNWGMYLVTSEEFPRWGGYIGRVKTKDIIKKMFPLSWRSIEIIPWSLTNLAKYARQSKFAIIPIAPDDKFAGLKSENKLLSMWHLDLECFVSDIPSYRRVMTASEHLAFLTPRGDWLQQLERASLNGAMFENYHSARKNYLSEIHTAKLIQGQWSEIFEDIQKIS
jgi:hypothetical protein